MTTSPTSELCRKELAHATKLFELARRSDMDWPIIVRGVGESTIAVIDPGPSADHPAFQLFVAASALAREWGSASIETVALMDAWVRRMQVDELADEVSVDEDGRPLSAYGGLANDPKAEEALSIVHVSAEGKCSNGSRLYGRGDQGQFHWKELELSWSDPHDPKDPVEQAIVLSREVLDDPGAPELTEQDLLELGVSLASMTALP